MNCYFLYNFFGEFSSVLKLIKLIPSIFLPSLFTWKCKCGPVEYPVVPIPAICCPAVTLSPAFTLSGAFSYVNSLGKYF